MKGLWLGAVGLALVGACFAPVALAAGEGPEGSWARAEAFHGALKGMRASATFLRGATDKGGALALQEAERDLLTEAWTALDALPPQPLLRSASVQPSLLRQAAYRLLQQELERVQGYFPDFLTYRLELCPGGGSHVAFSLPLRRHPRWWVEELGSPEGWQAEAIPSGLRLVAGARH